MTLPIPIAVHVRNGGSWKKTAPWARNPSAWSDQQRTYAKAAGAWKTCWTDLERSLNKHGNISYTSLDVSAPLDAGAGHRYNVDGSTDFFEKPDDASFTESPNPWLTYSVGTFAGRTHAFEFKFTDNGTNTLTSTPTLGSFLDMASGPYTFTSNVIGFEGSEAGDFTIIVVDGDAGPGPTLHTYDLAFAVETLDL